MRNFCTVLITPLLILLTLSGCSKEPTEPYYDRANQAAEKAHNRLSED